MSDMKLLVNKEGVTCYIFWNRCRTRNFQRESSFSSIVSVLLCLGEWQPSITHTSRRGSVSPLTTSMLACLTKVYSLDGVGRYACSDDIDRIDVAGCVWWWDDVIWILSVNNENHDVLGTTGPALAIVGKLLSHYSNPPNNTQTYPVTHWWQSNSFYPWSSGIPFIFGVNGRTGFDSHQAYNFNFSSSCLRLWW